jgi:hypothetical protein
MTPTPTPAAPPPPIVIPLRFKAFERVQVMQKLQHAVPAMALLPAGVQALMAGVHGFELVLAVFEVLTSAWLLRLVGKEVRAAVSGVATRAVGHVHRGPDWAHLAAAAVIAVEVVERWHLHHRWSRPMILTGLVTLTLGLLHGTIERKRDARMSLRVESDGISFRPRRKKLFRAGFAEIERFDVGATSAELSTAAGRNARLEFGELRNPHEIAEALAAARLAWLQAVEARAAAAATIASPASPAGGAASANGAEALRESSLDAANAGG